MRGVVALVRALAASLTLGLVLAAPAAGGPFPATIALPVGFQPEGVAVGKGHTAYVGSIPTGAVAEIDLRSGEVSSFVAPASGRAAIGLAADHRDRLFVAAGPTGQGYVYDARTGASLAVYQLAAGDGPTFVNDVVVTRSAAWFTDSFRQVLYRVAIAPNGTLGVAEVVPLGGDIVFGEGFNANGIDATPSGDTLVLVQSNAGALFTVDPATGTADRIALSGGDVTAGDGILLDGKTLYVVQNRLNRVAVVDLAPDLGAGAIVGHLTDPAFDVPTTVAELGSRLYAVNARFGTPDPESASYSVVQVQKRAGG